MDNKETFTQIGESIKENSNSVPNLSHRQAIHYSMSITIHKLKHFYPRR